MVKIAAFNPIPSASVKITANVKLLDRPSCRTANRRSSIKLAIASSQEEKDQGRSCIPQSKPNSFPFIRIRNQEV
jgi:hypothetical protein